jgi:3-deoxy-D-manno-octulosonic-acid transferase
MENFQALADGLIAVQGAEEAAGLDALHATVGRLLNSPDLVQQRAAAAAKFANGQAQVLGATMDALTPWLDKASGAG